MITTTNPAVIIQKLLKAETIGTLAYGSPVPLQTLYTANTLRIEVTGASGTTYSISDLSITLINAIPEEGTWNVDTKLWEQIVAPVDGSITATYTVDADGISRVKVLSDSSADADTDGNIITLLGTGTFNKITSVDTLTI